MQNIQILDFEIRFTPNLSDTSFRGALISQTSEATLQENCQTIHTI